MFLFNVEHKLWPVPAQGDSSDGVIGHLPFDPGCGEEGGDDVVESILGDDVVDISIGDQNDPLLLLLHMVDFDEEGREDDELCVTL